MWRLGAELLNGLGSAFIDKGGKGLGEALYTFAARIDAGWSVPWYNLGLHYKNCGRWEESLKSNQRAVQLDPSDKAGWWNLGIAATALKNWPEARRAWKAYGISLSSDIDGEVQMPTTTACVRLNPKVSGEVVWGLRIDPARIIILNVPLPESGYRFRDILLNDGASDGTRIDESGAEVAVFNELGIWQVSEYSTFAAKLHVPDEAAEKCLIEICREHEVGVEDWSTIRFLCAQCSRGNPGPHECLTKPLEGDSRRFGFAAKTREGLTDALQKWITSTGETAFGEPELLVSAKRF
jgi:tetratricopeptide (TPR) repeat protein